MQNNPANDSEIIPAEVVVEMAGSAPWQWHEVRPVVHRRRWKLPLVLFVVTCLSTFAAGATKHWLNQQWIAGIWEGLAYAVPVMIILVCHELGHFIQAWRYGVQSSLPYFIPMPLGPIGTFGAVISMEPRMGHRRALFDIGITGPLAGLVPTLIFCAIGLHLSKPMDLDTLRSWVLGKPDDYIIGTPLLFRFLEALLVPGASHGVPITFHPMAFAGWVGLLITSLNLFPIGQLDGGHVLYSLLRDKANTAARLLLLAAIIIVALNFQMLGSWLLMLVLLIMMGPTHPPTANDEEPLGWFRIVLGWLTLAFIFIGFTPTPILYVPS